MEDQSTIKLKALFLLVSFSLNSVVGAACSLGVDMGFNSHHHEHDAKGQHNHSHNDREEVTNNGYHDGHSHKHAHFEGHKSAFDTENTVAIKASEDENCCKDFVVAFEKLDKQRRVEKANLAKIKIDHSSFILCSNTTFNKQAYIEPVRIPPVHSDLPPPDIRVFIQSFLI